MYEFVSTGIVQSKCTILISFMPKLHLQPHFHLTNFTLCHTYWIHWRISTGNQQTARSIHWQINLGRWRTRLYKSNLLQCTYEPRSAVVYDVTEISNTCNFGQRIAQKCQLGMRKIYVYICMWFLTYTRMYVYAFPGGCVFQSVLVSLSNKYEFYYFVHLCGAQFPCASSHYANWGWAECTRATDKLLLHTTTHTNTLAQHSIKPQVEWYSGGT